MASFVLLLAAGLFASGTLAQSSSFTSPMPAMGAMSTNGTPAAAAAITAVSSSAAPSDTSGPFSIDTQQAYLSINVDCVKNCLLPEGLGEALNCDDVTNDCACISAPVEAEQFITDCLKVVCIGATGPQLAGYGILAKNLYESYCSARYPAAAISAASIADISSASAAAAAAAMSSIMIASPNMPMPTMSGMPGMTMSMPGMPGMTMSMPVVMTTLSSSFTTPSLSPDSSPTPATAVVAQSNAAVASHAHNLFLGVIAGVALAVAVAV